MKSRLFWMFIFVGTVSPQLFAQTAVAPTGGGSSANPYLVSSVENLYWITQSASRLSLNYRQTADIDASVTAAWAAGAGFLPIGNAASGFSGHYDGAGFTITGLTINRPTTNYVGMFGNINGGTVKDLTLMDVNIRGQDFTGGLVGQIEINTTSFIAPTVTGVSVLGSVQGRNQVGGVIGYSVGGFSSTLSQLYAQVSVTGTQMVGGLIGISALGATTSRSYATGSVSGSQNVGGFMGVLDGGTITESYASGSVTGTTNAGGFVGQIQTNVTYGATFTNVYWNTTTSGRANAFGSGTAAGVTGLNSAQMRQSASFMGFNFTTNWVMQNGIYFPVLQTNSALPLPGLITFAGGDGTAENPYQVAEAEHLFLIRYYLSSHFILTASIDMAGPTGIGGNFWDNGRGWRAIGGFTTETVFRGHFDGNGRSISNLFINRSSTDGLRVSLFGTVSGGTIKNVALLNVNITGSGIVGGLVSGISGPGWSLTGNIVTGTVSGAKTLSYSNVGGLAATFGDAGEASNNHVRVTVSGRNNVGGLVGNILNATVSNNLVEAEVDGLLNVGGFAGSTNSTATLSNNYWNTTIAGVEVGSSSGTFDGITGLTSAQMRQQASFAGFNFNTIWLNNAPNYFPTRRGFTYPLSGFAIAESSGSGRSLEFTSGEMRIPHNDRFNNLEAMSIEFWVFMRASQQVVGIMEKHSVGASGWWIRNDRGAFRAGFVTEGGLASATMSGTFQLNTWQHVVVQYTGSSVQIYVDGNLRTLSASSNGSGFVVSNTQEIQVGSNTNGANRSLDGFLDELRIWGRTLTQDEIRQNKFQKLRGDESGLLAYYPFDEMGGRFVDDKSTASDYGTLTNQVALSASTHPYGTYIYGSQGWRILSSPVDNVTFGSLLDGFWTQGFTGASSPNFGNSNVLKWNEAARSFTSISNITDTPAAGEGFAVFVFDDQNFDGTPDGFPKVIRTAQAQRSATVQPSVSFTDSGTLANDGWNLIGNPYASAIDWGAEAGLSTTNLDATFYVWNAAAGEYQSYNGFLGTTALADGRIAPWQGFWVKANAENPAISFTDEVRSGGGTLRRQQMVPSIRFTLQQQDADMQSSAVIMFAEQATSDKDPLDAYKLLPLRSQYVSLFTQLEDGVALDINALPLDLEDVITVPLQIAGTHVNGGFQLEWETQALPEDWRFTLRDNETGVEVDMKEASDYVFQLALAKAVAGDGTGEDAELYVQHGVVGPQVMKATTEGGSRFTVQINPAATTSATPRAELPQMVELQQNYPNPFNPSSTIRYAVPEVTAVRLDVFDVLGRRVQTLVNNDQHAPGQFTIEFNAGNLTTGVYFYRLQAGNTILTRKLTLIK
jgi:hypothetical protein